MPDFTHLHVHTQYSILDGAANIGVMMKKVKEYGMNALAITDHGNMYGVLNFVSEAKTNGIKPIIGCEVYVAKDSRFEKKGKEDRSGYHLILLAKNKNGYHNLSKLVSLGFKEGFYYTPRIDKELLRKFSKDIICSSACLAGEVPKAILRDDLKRAEELIKEHKEIFGDDYYLELMRHGLEDQDIANKAIIELAKTNNVKVIATNDIHFINSGDAEAHHIQICLNTGQDVDDEGGLHYSGNEFLRTQEEMLELFSDIPEAISNTREIVDKVESYDLNRDVILPKSPLPKSFKTEDEYLYHLTFEGAKNRYSELNNELKDRLEYELSVIKDMGFAGYFLIVQDFINEAKKMDVMVGPGRGSAAGSAVAFCIGITNIDPIKYNLLFERFLNPERISMPDIDIDFDDDGRDKVIKYVINKYGKDRVAQIVTFGTMAARSSIRDVARVLKLPLNEADKLAKLVPEVQGVTLSKAYKEVKELREAKKNGGPLVKKTLAFAEILEGSVRHTGTHACGVIIGPDDLIEHIPLSTSKDSELMVTQFEGKGVEKVGMLKMDFLGLKTLTIIMDALKNIKKSEGIDIDINKIPLDDKKTIKLFQEAKTIGIFQFESDGMRSHLQKLKPTDIEDLIAMNALYRPGPMEYIPMFIDRKHGKTKVKYPHPLLEEILKPTYGIMVYQEQIMQTAQIIGGFSLGKADILRRAMGKKNLKIMQEMKSEFIEGAGKNKINGENAEEIFKVMEKFAAYGFNRSHSTAYSIVAYQTAYLKANYPAEYMAAVLANNMQDIKKVNFFISESSKMGIEVLGPDINESNNKFAVNENKIIRFGLGAIKGVGEAAVESILDERDKNENYKDIFDFTSRVNLRAVNKKTIENLAATGAFDSFSGIHRGQYFYREEDEEFTAIDKAIRYGNKIKEIKGFATQSLFGESELDHIMTPKLPTCEPWPTIEILKKEKELIGFYVSGHPLDDFKIELDHLCTINISHLNRNMRQYLNRSVTIGGIITKVEEKISRKGNKYGIINVEDFTESITIYLWNESYLKFKHLLEPGIKVYIKATVTPRFRDSSDLTLDIIEISLLSEIREKLLKTITVLINLKFITNEISGKLEKLASGHPGKSLFNIKIQDIDENISLLMTSHSYKINPTNEFFKELEELDRVDYKLN